LWQRLFPAYDQIFAIGYGRGSVDFNQFERSVGERTTLFSGDQSDLHFLGRVEARLHRLGAGGKLDLIVDDGSHIPRRPVYTKHRPAERELSQLAQH